MENNTPPCPTCLAPLDDLGLCPRCLLAGAMAPTEAGQSESLAPSLEDISASFPDLEVLKLIGKGGMGAVYKCRQKSLDRFIALKILPQSLAANETFALRFQAEAKALAALNHPNIVTIHDFGHQGGFYFLLMEYVDGLNLRHLIRSRKLKPEEALAIIPPLCEALQFAHDRHIVHRDIKPENLLLDSHGRIKIADFGIATIVGQTDPTTEKAAGTPVYMAPEQRTNATPVDARSDIYSLGVVLYEMLTGERPDASLTPPSQKATLDVRIDEIVLRALNTQPNLRWQSATEFNTQLQTLASQPEKDQKSLPPKNTARSTPRRARIAAICTLFSTLLLFIPLVLWSSHSATQRHQAHIAFLEEQLQRTQDAQADLNGRPHEQAEILRLDQTTHKIKKAIAQTRSLEVIRVDGIFLSAVTLSVLFALAFIALIIGLNLGWRHLSWLRRQSPEKPALVPGILAALLWPILLSATSVLLLVSLPINLRGWILSSFIVGLIAALGTSAWIISRTLAWIKNEPHPFSRNRHFLTIPLVIIIAMIPVNIITELLKKENDTTPTQTTQPNPELNYLQEKLTHLYALRANYLSSGLGSQHPEVRATLAQITAYEEQYQHLGPDTILALKHQVLNRLIADQKATRASSLARGLGSNHPEVRNIQSKIDDLDTLLNELPPLPAPNE